jgi:hypothetical protein
MKLILVAIVAFGANAGITTMPASDPRVDWSGRVNKSESVSFDWLGVTARLQVKRATYVAATITSNCRHRGTRMRVYASDQGFSLVSGRTPGSARSGVGYRRAI